MDYPFFKSWQLIIIAAYPETFTYNVPLWTRAPILTAGLRQPSWCLHTWGEGNTSWNIPRTATANTGSLGRGVLKLSWHRAWWLPPSQGCHGSRCCYQNLPGVMGLAGVTCKSEARRKQYVKKKRLLELCGDCLRNSAAILFMRLFQACFFH